MNKREYFQQIAEETMEIIEKGSYKNKHSKTVDVSKEIEASVNGTKLYTPSDTSNLLDNITSDNSFNTKFEVMNETTLEGASRLLKEGHNKVLALNFASAKHPGGGFLRGSTAQEESLARSSGLYASISKQEEMYEFNKQTRTGLYSDYMIYSPDIPVFRHDNGELLDDYYKVSFVTSPAVNAGIVSNRESVENKLKIQPTMQKRIEKILAVALENEYDVIVLGAFGCGVFKNKPNEVAGYFRKALRENPKFKNRFKKIVFSVLDKDRRQDTIRPFRYAFS